MVISLTLLDAIKESIITGNWWFSEHAINKCDQREIDIEKLLFSIIYGEIIEEYPDNPRGQSCLILSMIDRRPVHTVCGLTGEGTVFITAYWPDEAEWIDERTRRVKNE